MRLLCALGAAMFVFGVTLMVSLSEFRGIATQRTTTFSIDKMLSLKQRLIERKKQTGALPDSLDALELKDYERKDPWGNPILYKRQGDGYVLHSLGADGKLGGEGIDADRVIVVQPDGKFAKAPKMPPATLHQLFTDERLRDVRTSLLTACFVNALTWFFVIFQGTNPRNAPETTNGKLRSGWASVFLGGGLLVIFAITTFGAVIMALLECIPSGH